VTNVTQLICEECGLT